MFYNRQSHAQRHVQYHILVEEALRRSVCSVQFLEKNVLSFKAFTLRETTVCFVTVTKQFADRDRFNIVILTNNPAVGHCCLR